MLERSEASQEREMRDSSHMFGMTSTRKHRIVIPTERSDEGSLNPRIMRFFRAKPSTTRLTQG